MSEIINVKYKAPQIPCIAFDEYYQVFILRDMVIATDEHGKKEYFDGSYFDPKAMDFKEVIVDGIPVKIMRKVACWMPIPNAQEETDGWF